MAIEYHKWAPIENMPNAFADAIIQQADGSISVVLIPMDKEADRLLIGFHHVLAYAFYDDFAFAVGDIEYGIVGAPTFIVKNYDWPGPHKRYEDSGFKDVTCYRFGSQNAIVDVLASGIITATWIKQNGA